MNDDMAHVRQIVLMIANGCNLNCKYCYESFKTNEKMSFDTARELLEHEFKNKKIKRFIIDLLGGEPLLNFELIKQITEWVHTHPPSATLDLNVRTNGTLLSPKMKKWFLENKNKINLGLSLDGLGQMQREGRTAFPVDINFFVENWPRSRINIVVFTDTVKYLTEAIFSLREKNALFSVEIACGIRWTKSAALALLQQLCELIPLYVSDPDEARASGLFKYSVRNFFPQEPLLETNFCGDMTNIVAYAPNGKNYCCHMFTPIVIGEELAEKFRNFTLNKRMIPLEEKCRKCPWVMECKLCFAMNVKICGDIFKSSSLLTTCTAVHALGIATAYFYMENLKFRIEKQMYIAESELELGVKVLELLTEFNEDIFK